MSFMDTDDSLLDYQDEEDITSAGASCKKGFRKRRARVKDLCKMLDRELGRKPRYDSVRFDDIADFGYRFQHRARLPTGTRELMEIAAAKLCWDRSDGQPGYFKNALACGVPVHQLYSILCSIDPTHKELLRLDQYWYERVIRCGLYTVGSDGKRNSGRCHQTDICSLCCWLDHTRPLVDALDGRCFGRAPHWYFATVSFTSDASSARAIGKLLSDEDFDLNDKGVYRGAYLPRPFNMHYDDICQVEDAQVDARHCMSAVQQAMRDAYSEGLFDGAVQKFELAIDFVPFRFLPHQHSILNSTVEDDPQRLAAHLRQKAEAVMRKFRRRRMKTKLWTDVRIYKIATSMDLKKIGKYVEKPADIVLAINNVFDACGGKLNFTVSNALKDELLAWEDLVLSTFRAHWLYGDHLSGLRRRYRWGNLRYGRGSIFSETPEHRQKREQQAARQRLLRQIKRQSKREARRQLVEDRPPWKTVRASLPTGLLNGIDLAILKEVHKKPTALNPELARACARSVKTVERRLKAMREVGLVTCTGGGRGRLVTFNPKKGKRRTR